MTGTSLDGLDGVLVRVTGTALDIEFTIERHVSTSFGPLRRDLRAAAEQEAMAAGAFARLGSELAALHVDLIRKLMREGETVDLVAVHGQTVFHEPPLSWQLINPHIIAHRFGVPVVSDMRQADLAAGGEGAPLTPITDWIMFRHPEHARAIVNLGGFCNVTVLPAGVGPAAIERVDGFDVCACNQLLDEIARRCLGADYDEDGRAARSGEPVQSLSSSLLEALTRQRQARRSLGTADALHEWVAANADAAPPADIAATVVAAVADCVAETIDRAGVREAILAGGGCRNAALVDGITRRTSVPILQSSDCRVPIEAREAAAIAILGTMCADGAPITLAPVTGRANRVMVAGSWCLPRGLAHVGEDSRRVLASQVAR